MINISYFYDLLESIEIENRRRLITCKFRPISCPCRGALLHRPMLILACLTEVSGLVESMSVVMSVT